MTPQTLNMIAIGFYAASLLFLIIGIYFFFSLHIVEVFNDLSGRAVKKQLQRIQTQTQPQSQSQVGKPSLPSVVSQTSKKHVEKSDVMRNSDREIQLDEGTQQNLGSEPTDVLFSDSEPTTLLEKEEMTVFDSEATTVLSSSSSTPNTSESMIHVLKREVVIHAEIDPELKKIETDS